MFSKLDLYVNLKYEKTLFQLKLLDYEAAYSLHYVEDWVAWLLFELTVWFVILVVILMM